MEQRCVSEAWWSLDHPLLNPVSAINALWPAEAADAEARIKRSAAMALYLSPSNCSSSVPAVAAAVDKDVGSTKKLGLSKSFGQLFVPAAAANSSSQQQQQQQQPAAIYLVQVPEAQLAAAALLQQLRPLLEEAAICKVMHDARWDSCVLQAQFGVTLAGVLDTQLLAGLTNLAARSAGQSAAAAAAAADRAADGGGSSSSAACQWDGAMGRVGLGRLYEACGFPEPTKGSMAAAFDANPRLWFSRPLPADAIEYAANDVRYLLPAAHSLLQQLPAALMALGSLQQLLSQQGPQALRLQQQLLPGVGRHLPGVALLLADLLSSMKASLRGELGAERPQSLLLLGRPGSGKTTLLRDIARLMSLPPSEGGLGLAVIIVDTSNEIAGDAEECHPCIGRARRMMVARREEQAGVLVQAVQNHNPDVVVVDEIGTAKEVAAARTICERSVLLVGTAHGSSLAGLLRNPELRSLLGGLAAVTLGDAEAKASNAGHKTRFERAGAATFVTLLELQAKNKWRLHLDVEQSVDTLLAHGNNSALPDSSSSSSSSSMAANPRSQVNMQVRSRDASGRMLVHFESPAAARQALAAADLVAAAAAAG
ncbi:hypothetical protein OEZ85_012377 [Tetradesmus obliquus]|uniref:AAA+ ATPase domain-containing protein n=1 Tax=Tetradesmus obliquus TaxID=3088 RepID=A0ABY8TT74_TETOB|nr:hypothetical protein OEZ85_012377 [Tetradesmus obliquus]